MNERLRGMNLDVIDARYASGSRSVRIRLPTGFGLGGTVAEFVASRSADGPVLLLAPRPLHQQVTQELLLASPGIAVGTWGDGTGVEMATPQMASRKIAVRGQDAFAWIVVEECHGSLAPSVKAVVAHQVGARVLEALRMPFPHPGLLDVDCDIDLMQESVPAAA